MIKLKESYVDTKIGSDYQEIYNETKQEFQSGQKYQSWRLIPSRDLILFWSTFAKYGRVDEDKLNKIWEIIKENVLKIIINTEVWQGNYDFFDKDNIDEIPEEEEKRHALFISDRSGNPYVRSWSEVEGNARYSDRYYELFTLLNNAYNAETPEELMIRIDRILNFAHGLGRMSKWFVEGGELTLDKVRDLQTKGIHLKGKLSESKESEMEYKKKLAVMTMKEKEKIEKELRDSFEEMVYRFNKANDSPAIEEYLNNQYHQLVRVAKTHYNDFAHEMESGTGDFGHIFWRVLQNAPDSYKGLPQQHPEYKGKDKVRPIKDVLWPHLSYWFIKNTDNFKRLSRIEKAINTFIDKERLSESKEKNPRLTKCYELSGRYVSSHTDSILVHGKLINPTTKNHPEVEHAWVEEGDKIIDPVMDIIWPKKVYESLFKARPYKKYTFMQVIKIIDEVGTWGPWSDEEEKGIMR